MMQLNKYFEELLRAGGDVKLTGDKTTINMPTQLSKGPAPKVPAVGEASGTPGGGMLSGGAGTAGAEVGAGGAAGGGIGSGNPLEVPSEPGLSNLLPYFLAAAGAGISPRTSIGKGLGQGVMKAIETGWEREGALMQQALRNAGAARAARIRSAGGGRGRGGVRDTADIRNYEYYKAGEIAAGREPMSFGEWSRSPEGVKSITWNSALSSLERRFLKDEYGYAEATPGNRAVLDRAKEILYGFKESGMDPLEASTKAAEGAEAWRDQIESRYRYYIDEANEKGKGADVQSEIDRVSRAFLEKYGYIPE